MDKLDTSQDKIFKAYSAAERRIILLDYDGTLVPFYDTPQAAEPRDSLKGLLILLSSDPHNNVVLISGRDKENMDNWFSNLPISLVAEHGGFFKEPDGDWKTEFTRTTYWKDQVYAAFTRLATQYPGSFVEEKQFSLAWHYRAVSEIVTRDKSQILAAIRVLQDANSFLIYEEDNTIELRTQGVDKGRFVARYLVSRPHFDFLLAIGDGKTDEDLFEIIGEDGVTVRVGSSLRSSAKYYVERQADVLAFLKKLVVAGCATDQSGKAGQLK